MSEFTEFLRNENYIKLFNDVVKSPSHLSSRDFIKQRLERLSFIELLHHPEFFGLASMEMMIDFKAQAERAGVPTKQIEAGAKKWESFIKDCRIIAVTEGHRGDKAVLSEAFEELYEMLKKTQDLSPNLRAQRVRAPIAQLVERWNEGPGRAY